MELSIALCLVVLTLSAFVVVYTGTRGSAKRTICLNNLRNLGLALQLYSQDNDGAFPPSLVVLDPYVRNREVLRCPSANRSRETEDAFAADYLYRPGLCNEDRADEPVAGDDEPRHGRGGNILTVDGATRWWPTSRWRLLAEDMKGRRER
jgi:prepilin-type processing-associated H-X9-DG protein